MTLTPYPSIGSLGDLLDELGVNEDQLVAGDHSGCMRPVPFALIDYQVIERDGWPLQLGLEKPDGGSDRIMFETEGGEWASIFSARLCSTDGVQKIRLLCQIVDCDVALVATIDRIREIALLLDVPLIMVHPVLPRRRRSMPRMLRWLSSR